MEILSQKKLNELEQACKKLYRFIFINKIFNLKNKWLIRAWDSKLRINQIFLIRINKRKINRIYKISLICWIIWIYCKYLQFY